MKRVEQAGAVWRKSSRSNGQFNCVEVAFLGAGIALRDSKNWAGGPTLSFSGNEWRAFVASLERGQFTR